MSISMASCRRSSSLFSSSAAGAAAGAALGPAPSCSSSALRFFAELFLLGAIVAGEDADSIVVLTKTRQFERSNLDPSRNLAAGQIGVQIRSKKTFSSNFVQIAILSC